MAFNLKNRSFLSLRDFTATEDRFLLKLAADLKAANYAGFEVAAYDQGAHFIYLGPSGSRIGKKESIKDTARVLGRVYDVIEYRGFGQAVVETLAEWSGVPVYNGLTDEFHPTQIPADVLTMSEHVDKPISQVAFCFLGDAGNNMGDSLLIGAAKLGMDVRLCGPKSLWPDKAIVVMAQAEADTSGARLLLTEDVQNGVADCDFLYTDVWVSTGEADSVWEDRINLLKPYQVTSGVMAMTGNLQTKFMHCLPSFHNTDTEIGADIQMKFGIDAMEVTEDVFESPASIVFDQAENRVHTIKAILVAPLGS